MKLYVHKNPSASERAKCIEVSDDAPVPSLPLELMTVEKYNEWRDAQPPLVIPEPTLVSKDIVVRRIRAEGKLASMRQLIAGMTVDDQFEFAHLTQLNPADTRLRAGITNIGLDPDVILAP